MTDKYSNSSERTRYRSMRVSAEHALDGTDAGARDQDLSDPPRLFGIVVGQIDLGAIVTLAA